MTVVAQEAVQSTAQERIDAFLAGETENLWLKWQRLTPQERDEWRRGLGAAERTLLWYAIQRDCRKLLEEQQAAGSQRDPKPNGSSKPIRTQKDELHEAWNQLSEEQRATLQEQFDRTETGD